MKIIRITNPEISVHLLPWYVEDNKTPLEIGMELNDRMRENPDDTCVLLAVDKGYIKGVLIGYMDSTSLFVWQARKSKDMNRPRLIFQRLCEWGKQKNADKVQLISDDKRVRRLYKRKYGFTHIGEGLMEKEL